MKLLSEDSKAIQEQVIKFGKDYHAANGQYPRLIEYQNAFPAVAKTTMYQWLKKHGIVPEYPLKPIDPESCEDCQSDPYCRGLCRNHYVMAQRRGVIKNYQLVTKTRPTVDCLDCGDVKVPARGRRLCKRCYYKHYYRGTLATEYPMRSVQDV